MAWLTLNGIGEECIFGYKLSKDKNDKDWKSYRNDFYIDRIKPPRDSIKKIIGKDLIWNDNPVEIK